MNNIEKIYDWLNIQLEDVQMIYDAMGNEKAYGAIRAYQAMLAQLKLMDVITDD